MGSDPDRVLTGTIVSRSDNLPAPLAVEGRVVAAELTPGKFGSAIVGGIPFGVVGVTLRNGTLIFECMTMIRQDFTYTVGPGDPVKIYGLDDQLVADFLVPGDSSLPLCTVLPGDTCTLFLPLHMTDAGAADGSQRSTFDNTMTTF